MIIFTMNKVRKSFLKRFKITRKGKLLRQLSGQGHGFTKNKAKQNKSGKFIPSPKEFINYLEYNQ